MALVGGVVCAAAGMVATDGGIMKPGPKPRPTEARRLDGNPGHRPLSDDEPQPPPVSDAFDEPPPELDGLDVGAAYWRDLAPKLRLCRQITDVDRGALLALCIEWDRYHEARRHTTHDQPKVVSAGKNKYPMPNPWLAIQTKALAACLKLWPELGLTPSSRSRVTAEGPGPGGDAFSEFDAPMPVSTPPPTRH